jgi:uncharacterized protein (TIGR02145 family)
MAGRTGPGRIGTQTWMLKNLDVDTYRNGDPIPEVQNQTTWNNLTTGAWCYYNNDPALGAIYGKLYNWYAVNDSRGLAPLGWHIPVLSETQLLNNFLGGSTVAGGPLKAIGTTYWQSPNVGATNSTGFNGFGGGYRTTTFTSINVFGRFWLNTTLYYQLTYTQPFFSVGASLGVTAASGLSVRVIKD